MKKISFLLGMLLLLLRGTAQNITAAEYFFDTDPGKGNGTAISVPTPGTTVTFNATISATPLSAGFHLLTIRTKDATNVWSLSESRVVFISTPTAADVGPVNTAEYFIDTDPGKGNGTALSVGTSGNTVTFTSVIPTTSLSNGFHTLSIRTRSSDKVWGLFETRLFYISAATADMGIVTAAEYFIDTDPGKGNGAALTVATPGNVINQTFLCNVPGGTANGGHVLGIRTRDVNNTWSLFELDSFQVAGTLPLYWLSFTGKKESNKIELNWVTENEVNTSHFNVERSKNGIDFSAIGTVAALSASHNNYLFNDPQPLPGVNFYRLKQVDIDGKSDYSITIRILWGDDQKSLKLYPDPVVDNLYADFAGTGEKIMIQIYDAAGRFVRSRIVPGQSSLMIPVQDLSKGMYWITISDGIILQKGKFMKN